MVVAATLAAAATPALITLATGSLHSNAHDTRGTAPVIDPGQGRRVPRLTNFATSNCPDVRVYLVAAGDVQDNATVKPAGFVELGPMKGNIGDQNYDIPATLDLADCRTVTIWCKRFSVNFGSAPLVRSRPESPDRAGHTAGSVVRRLTHRQSPAMLSAERSPLSMEVATELRDALSRRQKELPARWLAALDATTLREDTGSSAVLAVTRRLRAFPPSRAG